MKQLATDQYLFMIIADSDYIYGTNYLFCQGYIGNGMQLTPEKIIQAIGRIGRGQQGQQNSIRFRNIRDIQMLFLPQEYNPEVENIMVTINYINDGGPFSIYFDKSDLSRTEDMLRAKFEVIRKAKKPKLSKTWMCNKLCHFGKSTFENTDISPIVEYRDGQICKANSVMTKCEQIKHDTILYGIDTVVDLYKHKNYTIGKYKAPGCIE